ncbi:MAG: helix-turn-helix transcriptional regulator [Phycisphaerales bacterium]|nr:MAG: helix-turn-helix transcriptional regulator [Phycisphaerales bacterium]
MAINRDLVAASATPLILSILAEGDNYGYAIIKRVCDLSGGRMEWTDGMLYPVLHRLEQQKLIRSFERLSEQGRRRRYYRLNKRGVKALTDQKNQWLLVYSTLRKVWEKRPCLT